MKRRASALLLLAVLHAAAGEAGEAGWKGRPLVDVLEMLRARGLVIIYSSTVVPRDLVVTVEPVASDPAAMLAEILAPLGLDARPGPAGALVIAPAAAPDDGGPLVIPGSIMRIVVTPGMHSLLDEDTEASRTIGPTEILRVPSIAGDVGRLAERLPGVAAADNSAAFHARGSLTADTSLVLDGLELYEPYHLVAFQAPFTLVDSHLADQIELRNGGFTVDRGDRHGAFLDIATVNPVEKRGELEVGTLNSRLSFGAPVAGAKGSFLTSFRAWYPEAFLDTLELGAGERLRPRFEDLYAKLGWTTSAKSLLSVHALLARDRLSWEESGEVDREVVDADTESGYAWVRFLASVSDRTTTETALSGGRVDTHRLGTAVPDDGVVELDDKREMRFFGLTEDVSLQASPSQLLRAGVALRSLSADYRYGNVVAGDPDATRSFATSPEGISASAYLSHRVRLSPRVATELGVRWDRQEHTGDSQIDPRFHLVWNPSDATEFRIALGRYSQSQRINELHVEDGETTFLPAEVSRQLETSLVWRFPSALRLRIDAYTRSLSDLRPRYENLFQPLDLFPETSEDRVTVAPSEARLRGIEILLSREPERGLLWWVSYTRSSAEDLIDGTYVARSWDQPHAAKFVLGYESAGSWLVSLAGSVHTGWPTTPISAIGIEQPDGSIEVETEFGPRNSIRFPGYGRLDLKIRRAFAVGRGRLSLTIDVNNLTDRKNVCCVDDLSFGTAVEGPVAVTPEYSYWLGITPSFQIRYEF